MRKFLRLLHWVFYGQLSFVGFGRIVRIIRGTPRFLGDFRRYKKDYHGEISAQPCLTDWYEESGVSRGEYFWQDLYVARKIFEMSPRRHVDIGSRVDGFVAHVASYREIEVLDIRANTARVPGVVFGLADLMDERTIASESVESISCLHALEHFGLGRYGDKVNVDGWSIGLQNMAKMLKPNGLLYLSVPSGRPCVYFNAHRVFSPWEIKRIADECLLELKEFATCNASTGVSVEDGDIQMSFDEIEQTQYVLGIYLFQKAER